MTDRSRRPRSSGTWTLRGYLSQRGNLLTNILLVFPLYLFYQLAVVLLPGVGNGADLLTGRLVALANYSRADYLLLQLALTGAFFVAVLLLRRRQQFDPRLFVPVVLESGIYALTMGSLILSCMGFLGISPSLSVESADLGGPLTRIALSIGAGVHEELVFRLLLLNGAILLFHRIAGWARWSSLVAAFLLTAVLFSAAHHLVGGEPFAFGVFVYRLLSGLFFAGLYLWRGFAVAVYTHALYDIYVMLWR